MTVRYVKRFNMMFDTEIEQIKEPKLPAGFFWMPWTESLMAKHADVKHRGFRNELDAVLFPTFAHYESCLNLMKSILSGGRFLPSASWLIAYGEPKRAIEHCACIQGLNFGSGMGAIQNIAVLPGYRRRGLGQAILLRSLQGFKQYGVTRISLDVTAENEAAIRLYKQTGFRTLKTVFKESYYG